MQSGTMNQARSTLLLLLLLVVSCTPLAQSKATTSFKVVVSRRSTLAFILTTVAAASVPVLPALADTTGDDDDEEEEARQLKLAAQERMAQRIADSKKNYRKPTDLVQERKENTDYSCVAAAGSPCPEGLVPRQVQKGIVEALETRNK
mmetsp:Transcript_53003/g.128582  ORF Transcript_53003/g.128582 Transcript_53003/m.128582 type:complete len:148 (-) Transcript_53003:20-463(-)